FGAAASTNVTFDADATGTLKLVDSFDFSGMVSGFNQDDNIDLLDMVFGAGTAASYVENQAGTGGTLSVTDGTHAVNLGRRGQYLTFRFRSSTTSPALFRRDAVRGDVPGTAGV